ncbi:MAG: SDR family oxidoreductase [Pirellulales bacterium]|nr:SDR family oxidoreductase [Pirellulales bacterium]
MKTLLNKRCLLTGAASGIGRAFALQLAAKGVRLILVDKDRQALAEVATACQATGTEALPLVCDLTDRAAISRLVTDVRQQWETVDLLINNAGVAFYGPTETMSQAQWDWLLQINLLAPIQITTALLPGMLTLPEAHILNVCSISGLVAAGRFAAYHVSKFGLVGYSEALRAEYVRRGIGVTALCPGPVTTNLYNAAVSGRPDRAVPNPPNWLCATPETVAATGIRAIERNQGMVLVTLMAHALWRAKRWFPGVLDFLNRITRKKHRPSPTATIQTSASSATLAGPHAIPPVETTATSSRAA